MSSAFILFIDYGPILRASLRNVEATLGGKSDPYMRVQINNVTKGRTEVINNSMWFIVTFNYHFDTSDQT
jgi:Ca2+-dependent lipid-binding protein